jgi:hypothetical protein
MKRLVLATFLIVITSCENKKECDKHIIHFGNEQWTFPSTIGAADKRHHLSFHSPAYYYKMCGSSHQVILGFDWKSGDFDNDRQPKEDLFSCDINTYIFQVRQTGNTYDSLIRKIESIYGKKFTLVKGTKTDHLYNAEKNRPFEHCLLKVDSCLTVGIKNSRSHELGNVVTVHYMFGLSLGDVGLQVGNY